MCRICALMQSRISRLFFIESIYRPYLKISRERASTLVENLPISCVPLMQTTNGREIRSLKRGIQYREERQFREVFLAELNSSPVLFGDHKRYDVNLVISFDNGWKLFPPDSEVKCPKPEDMNEAGKALAI